jgi:hypothetical protein
MLCRCLSRPRRPGATSCSCILIPDEPFAFIAARVLAGIVVDFQFALVLSVNIRREIEKRLFEIEVTDGISTGSYLLADGPLSQDIPMSLFADQRLVADVALIGTFLNSLGSSAITSVCLVASCSKEVEDDLLLP